MRTIIDIKRELNNNRSTFCFLTALMNKYRFKKRSDRAVGKTRFPPKLEKPLSHEIVIITPKYPIFLSLMNSFKIKYTEIPPIKEGRK